MIVGRAVAVTVASIAVRSEVKQRLTIMSQNLHPYWPSEAASWLTSPGDSSFGGVGEDS